MGKEGSRGNGLQVGDRIISLVKWGGHSRYLSINPSHTVSIPESVDPSVAACLAETYLAAFQGLHRGQAKRIRYREDSLKGKTVLLRGYGISAVTHAVVQLAKNAGALKIFAVAKFKHFDHLASIGVSPLNHDATVWLKSMTGKVDIIISSENDAEEMPYELLNGGGQVIVFKSSSKNGFNDLLLQPKRGLLCGRKGRATLYDVYEEWDNNLGSCKSDLQHLVHLLECRKVEPNVLDRIALDKVAKSQEIMASRLLSGFIVCEPWLVGKSRTICL
jgi:NADPH:quinone reductase-like Zn-dependent oxidoreductase